MPRTARASPATARPHQRGHRRLPRQHRRRGRCQPSPPRKAYPGLAAHQPHSPRRAVRQPRPARQARHRRPGPAHGPRVRQGRHRVPGRGRRRPAHDPVRLRHRPHADGRRAGLGDRREGRLHAPQAVGRRRRHHAVELPLRRAAVDARAEPARRQHGRLQAVGGHAGHRSAAGRTVRGSRLSAGRHQPACTATARPARRWCAIPASTSCCSPAATTSASAFSRSRPSMSRSHRRLRDGQQECRHRLRGRPARPGRDRGPHQRLQDQRPALRLGGPHPRRTRS